MAVLEEPAVTGSRLDRLLAASVTSRLHLALVLVGRVKAPADVVVDLSRAHVDLDANLLLTEQGVYGFGERVARLFYWHGAAQRLDACAPRAGRTPTGCSSTGTAHQSTPSKPRWRSTAKPPGCRWPPNTSCCLDGN